ncbi:MAG: SDR family NAD(P)-dependent oxidoreductase [bacterium]|nr:SDR family NAD(P)-dependent oxidoreductase [bacterium]
MSKILITGAATGIGRDSAITLAKLGHNVIATAKRSGDFIEFQEYIREHNLQIEFVQLDVTKEEELQFIAETEPDVLINNAAIGESGPLSEIPMERVKQSIETNVYGVIRGSQLAAVSMLKKNVGRIIIVGSTAGKVVIPFMGAYHMTKFALEAAADGLRLELEPRGIFVSLIEPGKIDTGFNQRMAATKHEWLDQSSAFSDKIERMKFVDKEFWTGGATTDSVVKAIVDAVEAKKPRARYVAPKINSVFIWLVKLLPDRLVDKGIRAFTKLK